MNETTPRIFIAATEQNAGKTTTSLGLYSALRSRFPRMGFIKPVGQRFTEVEGKLIDEDSLLIQETFQTETPIEAMSPIAVEPDFTRRYINQANGDYLVRRIQNAFDRASWEKDFVIIEGTGHAGVGSVFDLSNARVAKILHSKVILVTTGGIGRPIDEIALNRALFDREGVEVIGVIINKVLPSKLDYITDFARRGLERLGLPLIGVVPRVPELSHPNLSQVSSLIQASYVNLDVEPFRKVAHVMIGAMTSGNVLQRLLPDTLLIVPGDREDVILAALAEEATRSNLAGVVLSDDLMPQASIVELIAQTNLPVLRSAFNSYAIASRIHSMTVKTLPGDDGKIGRIQEIVGQHVNIEAILTDFSVGK